MNLNKFIKYVKSASIEYSLKADILARTENAVKIRLEISPTIFVQFYHHQKSNTSNYVLVGWNRRLYGRDSVGGTWHRHLYQNPLEHDTSREGAKAVTPYEFLKEVFDILQGEGLYFKRDYRKEEVWNGIMMVKLTFYTKFWSAETGRCHHEVR